MKDPSPKLIATTRSARSPPFLIDETLVPGSDQHAEVTYQNPQMLKGGTIIDMVGEGAMSPESVELPGTPDSDLVEDKV